MTRFAPSLRTAVLVLAATSLVGALPRQVPQQRWRGPDGDFLPFGSAEEVVDFLRSAQVVDLEGISQGVTDPRKALLERDGVRAHAILHDHDIKHERVRLTNGEFFMSLEDSAMRQCAGYEMARLLGLDNVPPTVMRRHRGKNSSLQLWIENVISEQQRIEGRIRPPDSIRFMRQVAVMRLFDTLIGNVDRHANNILVDRDTFKVWLIDHTRAFQVTRTPPDLADIIWVDRHMWDAILALDEAEVRAHLRPYLAGPAIDSMFDRRDLLIEHVRDLLHSRGEDAVFFELHED